MNLRRRGTLAALTALALALLAPGIAAAQVEGGARKDDPPAAEPPRPPQLTQPPVLIESVAPEYPPEALAIGLTADVTMRIAVDATGAVTKAEVVKPVGHGFDEAAIAAALKYRFKPAEWDGKPGPINVETTIHFTLVEAPVIEPLPEPGVGGPAAPVKAGKLTGVVKERGTRKLLSGVAVVIQGPNLEAFTDAEGRFSFDAVPEGEYRVLAVLSGYDRFEVGIGVAQGEEAAATLYLRPTGGNPYETTVELEKEKLEVTRRTIDRRQMTSVPGTFGDPLRVIQNLPGMARSPYVLGLLLIRGSGVDDSGVYVDGHEVPLLYHFLGGPSILNPEFLDTIDLYPGGFPSRFGRNIGGVIDVTSRAPKHDGIHGSADIDLIDSSVYLRAPLGKKVAFAFAARRSYIDALLPFFLPEPDAGEQLVVVPVYWDYQARLDVDLPGVDTLSFMFFGSDDELDVLQSDAEETFNLNTHIGFNRVRATYATKIGAGDGLRLTISPTYGKDVVSFDGGEFTAISATQTVFGLRERVVGELTPWLRLDTGLDLEYRINSYKLRLPIADDIPEFGNEVDVPPETFERQVDSYGLGAWIELALDLGHAVRLIPGVRMDTYLLAGEPRISFDPRLVARWQADPRMAYKAYAGIFHQAPSAEGFDAEFGNPDLELEYAVHTGIGAERRLTRALTLEGEAYYVGRRNQATFVPHVIRHPDGSISPIGFANEATGFTYGLEMLLRHEVTKNFYGWLSYTLSRSEQRRRPGFDSIPTNFDQTHNFILVASYRTDGGWELGARMRGVSGSPKTPTEGATYDADDDDYRPLRPERRSERGPFFHQLDLRAEKTWLFDTWSIAVYLDILNVYNAENPEATQYDYRYRNSASVRGVPFVPTIGVKGQW